MFMKKKFKILTAAAITILLFSALFSCNLFSPLPDYAGNTLSVDADGHFKEDIIYKYADGSTTYEWKYLNNGNYEFIVTQLSGTTWEQTNGVTGTYSWDPKTLLLSKTLNKAWDGTSYIEPANYPLKQTGEAYFTSTVLYDYGEVYKKSETENTWEYTITDNYDNGDKEIETESFVIDIDGLTYNRAYLNTESDSTDFTYKKEEKTTGTIASIFPEGVKFKKGETATFYVSLNEITRYWDTVNDEWLDWSTGTEEKYSQTLLHAGDFIIHDPSNDAARSLE